MSYASELRILAYWPNSHYYAASLRKIAMCPSVRSFFSLYVQCAMSLAIRYDSRCYFNVRSKADMSQLNLPHGNNN